MRSRRRGKESQEADPRDYRKNLRVDFERKVDEKIDIRVQAWIDEHTESKGTRLSEGEGETRRDKKKNLLTR